MPAGGGARRPKLFNKAAGGADQLDAAVASVGDGNAAARRVEDDGAGGYKLPVGRAVRPVRNGELYGVVVEAAPGVVEYLHAVVARVGDGDQVAVRGKGHIARRLEFPGAVAGPAEPIGGRAVDVEYPDSVVARVGDGEHAAGRDGDAARRREPVRRPKHKGRNAAGMKDLDAVVARVGDGEHAAVRKVSHIARRLEFPGAVAGPAEPIGRRAVGMEHLHAVVARVGDGEHAAAGRHGDAARRRESIGRAEHKGGRAVGMEHLHAVVARVGDGEHARPQGRRRAVVALGMRRAAGDDGGRGQQARNGDGAEQGEP